VIDASQIRAETTITNEQLSLQVKYNKAKRLGNRCSSSKSSADWKTAYSITHLPGVHVKNDFTRATKHIRSRKCVDIHFSVSSRCRCLVQVYVQVAVNAFRCDNGWYLILLYTSLPILSAMSERQPNSAVYLKVVKWIEMSMGSKF